MEFISIKYAMVNIINHDDARCCFLEKGVLSNFRCGCLNMPTSF